MAYRGDMTPQRPQHIPIPLLGVGLLVLVVAVGGLALLTRPGETVPRGPIGRTITWDAVTARLTLTDTADGHTVRAIPLGEPPNSLASQGNATVTLAADAGQGYIYVAQLTIGVIHAYAARDGRALWHASLLPRSVRPDGRTAMQAPVVDEAAGRVVSADLPDGRVILLRARRAPTRHRAGPTGRAGYRRGAEDPAYPRLPWRHGRCARRYQRAPAGHGDVRDALSIRPGAR